MKADVSIIVMLQFKSKALLSKPYNRLDFKKVFGNSSLTSLGCPREEGTTRVF